jgi:pseudaminic acid cytidylyltransferase
MIVGIIPARGGSKRIPHKNIRPFLGKPMIAYTIEAAQRCRVFDRIIVSTDDNGIATLALEYGAEVPFSRPAELANDYADTAAVMEHALNWLRDHTSVPQAVCCLYATAPFLQPEYIRAGLDLLQSQRWDYVFAATTFPYPIFRAFAIEYDGSLAMFQPEHLRTRSQDLPEAWHDAAQFYWGTFDAWLEKRTIFGERSTVVKLPRWLVQDIDTIEDWEMAERLYQAAKGAESKER